MAALTSGQEIEAVTEITLVAHKKEATLLGNVRLLRLSFGLCDFPSIGNTTTQNDSMIVAQIGSRSHLPSVCRKGASVVLFSGLVVKVIRLMQCLIVVVVRV